jgi:Holliday junction resolvase
MPSSASRKGKYYENKLLNELTQMGYEAWRVPASGSL